MTFKNVKKTLEKNDWVLVRTCGSHFQFKNAITNCTVTVPNHGAKDISIGVIKSLERATGLSFRG